MARGGRRAGKVGQAYSNRSDLNTVTKLPIMVAPSNKYGAAEQQMESQRAVPLAPAPNPGAGPAAGTPSEAPGPQPGSFGAFDRPTDRPHEPISAGAPFGPGPGAEAMGIGPQGPGSSLVAMLSQLAATSGSRDIAELAMRAQQLGGR